MRSGVAQRRLRGRVDHQKGLDQVVKRVGPERAGGRAVVVAQAVVEARKVGVGIDRQPVDRRHPVAAQQRADRTALGLDAARLRDELIELVL